MVIWNSPSPCHFLFLQKTDRWSPASLRRHARLVCFSFDSFVFLSFLSIFMVSNLNECTHWTAKMNSSSNTKKGEYFNKTATRLLSSVWFVQMTAHSTAHMIKCPLLTLLLSLFPSWRKLKPTADAFYIRYYKWNSSTPARQNKILLVGISSQAPVFRKPIKLTYD